MPRRLSAWAASRSTSSEDSFRLAEYRAFLAANARRDRRLQGTPAGAFDAERGAGTRAGQFELARGGRRPDDADAPMTTCPTARRAVDSAGHRHRVEDLASSRARRWRRARPLVIVESMKMEIAVPAPLAGIVRELRCRQGRARRSRARRSSCLRWSAAP